MADAATAQSVGRADALSWVVLDRGWLDAVEALHRLSLTTFADPTLCKPETRAFFAAILEHRGRTVGALADERLIAYGILMQELPAGDDTHQRLGLTPDTPLYKLAGAAVDPAFRGHGLQRSLIRRRIALAEAAGVTHLFSTSAPGNIASWSSLLTTGFRIRAMAEAYGGLTRFLLLRRSGDTVPPLEAAHWHLWSDSAGQRAALAVGRAGVIWRDGAAGREIAYLDGAA